MRNATTASTFALLIGFALALPAAAEEQNSSTLKTGPVSAIAADASSCSSASTLAESSRPAFSSMSVGFSTPRAAEPRASFQGAAEASANQRVCVNGAYDCLGRLVGSPCRSDRDGGKCRAYDLLSYGYACYCAVPPGQDRGR